MNFFVYLYKHDTNIRIIYMNLVHLGMEMGQHMPDFDI